MDKQDDADEQLRGCQMDEFKALKECFAEQLVDLRRLKKVKKKRKRQNFWLPLELLIKVDTNPEPIAGFELHVKCTRRYPLVPPAIGFKNVRGIGRTLIAKLHKQLKQEAASDEHMGQGCIALLIMRTQQFLEDHYSDLELNNKSFYEQMVERKQSCDKKAELSRKHQDEMDKLERERQVEEIRQKILRKRELYNESKKRRDSQSSTLENDPDDALYDYEGDLDGNSTTTSLTDEGEANRLEELAEETVDDEGTLIRSRRSTFVDCSAGLSSTEDLTGPMNKGLNRSRVGTEYEVIGELGHGGFGTVYKVRHKTDSGIYALKKVKLNPDNETLNEKIMREVKLLSRLNHENVIRYFTAWNETEVIEVNSRTESTTTGDDSAISSKFNDKSCILSQRSLSTSSDEDIDDVYHTSYLISEKNVEKIDAGETTANYVVFETSDDKDENEIVESMKKALGPKLSDGESSDEDCDRPDGTNTRLKIKRWLYIQMELGQGTLREAIDRGLPKQKDRARRFFREILDGLVHIHRQGIIHRDLKPVNIFLDSMDRPKIGDFGLATNNLFIVTQSSGRGAPTATAIKPNRMSLERLKMLASPEQGDSPGDLANKSGERLKYMHQTDNIGTPLYMSPELSATNEKTRIAKVVYSHKVDVYSLGIIYFEMLYPFKTGHERIIILQDLRERSITMPPDVEMHLTREDIELIKLLLTHDVPARPTSEKLLSSNLLPSIGLKEREYQNIIKKVVQNRQARTHKHMLRLLFEQCDSYVEDFVFDFEDVDSHYNATLPVKADSHNLLKDFQTNNIVLDQVKMKLEMLLRSRGYVNFVTPTLMPKYSASKYYTKQQLEDVVMLMDKNSSILTLPYDLRLPFARTIARTNINNLYRFAIEKIFRQRQILGYHPDQLWECCVDIVTPPNPNGIIPHLADAEILNLMGDVTKTLPVLLPLKPVIKFNHIQLVRSIMLMLGIEENLIDDLLNCITESMSVSLKRAPQLVNVGQNTTTINSNQSLISSLPIHVRDDLKTDILASRLLSNVTTIHNLLFLLDLADPTPLGLLELVEQFYSTKSLKTIDHLNEIRQILRGLEETMCYAQGLGLDLQIKISPGFVLSSLRPIDFYSGMVCLLECRRHNKTKSKTNKSVILAVGGRYDKLIDMFSCDGPEVPDKLSTDDAIARSAHKSKVAVGVSFEVEKLSRFVLEDYVDRVINLDAISSPSLQQLVHLNGTHGYNLHLPHSSPSSMQPKIRYWPIDIAVCSLAQPRSRAYIAIISNLIRQLREHGLMCNEILPDDFPSFSLNSLTMHCLENRIPYMLTIKSQSLDLSPNNDFLHSTAEKLSPNVSPNGPSSPLKNASSPSCNTDYAGYIVTLYQFDRNRLREMKRSDIPNMIKFLRRRAFE